MKKKTDYATRHTYYFTAIYSKIKLTEKFRIEKIKFCFEFVKFAPDVFIAGPYLQKTMKQCQDFLVYGKLARIIKEKDEIVGEVQFSYKNAKVVAQF